MTYKGIVSWTQTEVLQINRKIQKKTGQRDINRHFKEGHPQTAVYNITSTSSRLKEKETETKTVVRHHFTRTRSEELKSLTAPSAVRDGDPQQLCAEAGRLESPASLRFQRQTAMLQEDSTGSPHKLTQKPQQI